jgi:hypothetical protein
VDGAARVAELGPKPWHQVLEAEFWFFLPVSGKKRNVETKYGVLELQ